jgi:hypothetical protein
MESFFPGFFGEGAVFLVGLAFPGKGLLQVVNCFGHENSPVLVNPDFMKGSNLRNIGMHKN